MRLIPTRLTEEERLLQSEVREFLAEHLPPGSYEPGLGMVGGVDREFSRKLGDRGWLGMALPAEYGGGRTAVERLLVVAELLKVGAPVAYHWIADRQSGPSIAKNGSEEQKDRFLPAIARGELCFAIGMSEPDAGSDLASLRSRATQTDTGWRVNGTKVWTSNAADATHILALLRTGDHKYRGLTQFIIDVRTPGVRISPIEFIDGTSEFCEVVFDDVDLPDEARLGEVGAGWGQNTDELALERGGVDRWISAVTLLGAWAPLVAKEGPAQARSDLGAILARLKVFHSLSLSIARLVDSGHSPVLEAAMVKEMATRFEQECVNIVLRHANRQPCLDSPDQFERLLARATLVMPSWTIRGGTNEVLRNVIAKGLATT